MSRYSSLNTFSTLTDQTRLAMAENGISQNSFLRPELDELKKEFDEATQLLDEAYPSTQTPAMLSPRTLII